MCTYAEPEESLKLVGKPILPTADYVPDNHIMSRVSLDDVLKRLPILTVTISFCVNGAEYRINTPEWNIEFRIFNLIINFGSCVLLTLPLLSYMPGLVNDYSKNIG